MRPECCIFQHPFAVLVRILLQVYDCRILIVMIIFLAVVLNTIIVGILPDNAADRGSFKCFQTAVIAVIILRLDVIVGISVVTLIEVRIIIENVRFKIGVPVNACFCFRLGLLCSDEIVTVCQRGQIRRNVIIGVACAVLLVLRDQVAVHHLGFRIAVLPIAGNSIVFHAAGQRQQLQTIMCQHLFPIDFRICGNTGECVLAVCIRFHSTVSACYRYIGTILQNILFQLNSRSGNSLFIELSRAVLCGHCIADTVIVKCLLIFSGCIFTVVLPQITGYFRSLNFRKAAAVIQQTLCFAGIVMGVLIVNDIGVLVCRLAGNDNDIIFCVIVVVRCCDFAVCVILEPVIANEIVLHIAGILQVTVFRRAAARILLILGDRILFVQISVLLRIDIQPIASQVLLSVLLVISRNILEYIGTGFRGFDIPVFTGNRYPFSSSAVVIERFQGHGHTLDTLFKSIPDAVVVFIVPDPLSDKSTGAVHESQRNALVDLEGLSVIFKQRLLVCVIRHTGLERPCAEVVHCLGQIVVIRSLQRIVVQHKRRRLIRGSFTALILCNCHIVLVRIETELIIAVIPSVENCRIAVTVYRSFRCDIAVCIDLVHFHRHIFQFLFGFLHDAVAFDGAVVVCFIDPCPAAVGITSGDTQHIGCHGSVISLVLCRIFFHRINVNQCSLYDKLIHRRFDIFNAVGIENYCIIFSMTHTIIDDLSVTVNLEPCL